MMTLQQKLSAAVVEKAEIFFDYISRGFCVRDAYDRTMGSGAYDALVSDFYDAVHASAAA